MDYCREQLRVGDGTGPFILNGVIREGCSEDVKDNEHEG